MGTVKLDDIKTEELIEWAEDTNHPDYKKHRDTALKLKDEILKRMKG